MAYNQLDETSQKIIQPDCLNVELMQHQKSAVFAMKELENNGYVNFRFRYYDNDEKDLRIDTHIGILGDKVGSGKTLIITSLLLDNKIPTKRPTYFASDRFTTIRERSDTLGNRDCTGDLDLNVIMVPKGIQHQWVDCFNSFVNGNVLYFISLFDASNRDSLDLMDEMLEQDQETVLVVICNERTIADVIAKYGDKKWSRFIIDEADTIPFSTLTKISSYFTWLVTGTTNCIPYSKKKYIKEIFGKNLSWQPDFLTVKNSNQYIDTSIDLPTPNRIVIKCHTPYEVKLLGEHIPKNVMNMINAGNSDQAIRALNCHVDTTDNIFKVISRNYEMAIKNKKIELAAERKKKYTNPRKLHEHNKRIKKLESVIDRLEKKLGSMKASLYEANDEICPICMNEFEKPTFVDCCAHKYCFNCLTLTLESNKSKCPVCQKKITKKRMHILDDESDSDSESEDEEKVKEVLTREKMEEFLDIVGSKKDGKFLVFADYIETFRKIEMVLKKKKIRYGILTGGGKKVKSTISDFQKGKIDIIMLDAKNFGAGMNLQCATDIILYHRFTKEMEEQIIGRGQRLGRKGTLNVYYLIHDNEDSSFVDDSFNDINYQEYLETIEG